MTVWIAIAVGIVTNAIVSAFFYGRLTEQVKQNTAEIMFMRPKVDDHAAGIAALKAHAGIIE